MTVFGPYTVSFSSEAVDRYCAVTGLSRSPVPAALVLRLLTEPAVIADLRAAFGPRVPVHVSQSVTLEETIVVDRAYSVTLEAATLRAQSLRLTGTVRTEAGTVAARMVSDFILMDQPDATAA